MSTSEYAPSVSLALARKSRVMPVALQAGALAWAPVDEVLLVVCHRALHRSFLTCRCRDCFLEADPLTTIRRACHSSPLVVVVKGPCRRGALCVDFAPRRGQQDLTAQRDGLVALGVAANRI